MIEDLRTHPDQYVTVSQLARYWRISRAQIHKQIDAGTLTAMRLGPRLLRISTADAIRFEHTIKTSQNVEE
jgi:excisionase family DNA binding protein